MHNYTPQSKKGVRTPKNITSGKCINTRIKNILAITPKKEEEGKNTTGRKLK